MSLFNQCADVDARLRHLEYQMKWIPDILEKLIKWHDQSAGTVPIAAAQPIKDVSFDVPVWHRAAIEKPVDGEYVFVWCPLIPGALCAAQWINDKWYHTGGGEVLYPRYWMHIPKA